MDEQIEEHFSGTHWTKQLHDFLNWIENQKKSFSIAGTHEQSLGMSNGTVAFEKKYPSIKKAYQEYKGYHDRKGFEQLELNLEFQ